MRYVYLVGASKSGKTQVAKKLASTIASSRIVDVPTLNQVRQFNSPLGHLSDYRIETHIANLRALESMSTHPKNKDVTPLIIVNSPLTNLVYSTMHLDSIKDSDDLDEISQWVAAVTYIARVCMDTVWNDQFLFLAGNDGTEFGAEVEMNLKEVLNFFGFDYHTLNGKVLQKYEQAAILLDT